MSSPTPPGPERPGEEAARILGQEPRAEIDHASGREGHDEGDGPGRKAVVLSVGQSDART